MSYLLIRNGCVIRDGKSRIQDVLLKDGLIEKADFSGELPEDCEILDAGGCYVAPGFIELHAHGGGGGDFMDCDRESLRLISEAHLKNGTTTLYPTAMTADFSDILKCLDNYRRYAPEFPNFAGVHMEGPFLSVEYKGAHKEKFLHAPTKEEEEILLGYTDVVKRITAAPELPGMYEFAEHMSAHGVQMIVGHSNATSDIVLEAVKHGFSHITHFYNATPAWRKINEVLMGGVVEAGFLSDEMTIELICDGKHVAVDAGKVAYRFKGPDRIALVSDALRPAGEDVTESYIGEKIPENRVIIEDGVAKLPDRSCFAGSVATGSMILEKGVNYFGFSIEDTVKMMTETPARIMKRDDIGVIADGKAADIVVFDRRLRLQQVICKGKKVI